MSVESKDDNKQGIRELLEAKEAMIAHGPKGRMIVRRPRKPKTDKENIYKNSRRHLRTTQIHRTTHHFRTTPVVRTLPFIFIYSKVVKNILMGFKILCQVGNRGQKFQN